MWLTVLFNRFTCALRYCGVAVCAIPIQVAVRIGQDMSIHGGVMTLRTHVSKRCGSRFVTFQHPRSA